MALTHTTLLADLITYCVNASTEFAAQRQEFIELGESRLRRDVVVPEQLTHTAAAFTSGAALLTLPTGFIRFHSLFYETATADSYNPVKLIPLAVLMLYAPDRTATSAALRYYAKYSKTQLIVAPAPASAINYRLAHLAVEAAITSGNTTNWLTDNVPDLFFAACMVEAAKYERNMKLQADWEKTYQDGLRGTNAETRVSEGRDDFGGPAQINSGRS